MENVFALTISEARFVAAHMSEIEGGLLRQGIADAESDATKPQKVYVSSYDAPRLVAAINRSGHEENVVYPELLEPLSPEDRDIIIVEMSAFLLKYS